VVKGKHVFERCDMSKDEALEMFKYNDFKTDVLKRKVHERACEGREIFKLCSATKYLSL